MITMGISKISLGLPGNTPKPNPDDLLRVVNRIAQNIFLVDEAVETVARFILLAAKEEEIELEWNSKKREFRRVE